MFSADLGVNQVVSGPLALFAGGYSTTAIQSSTDKYFYNNNAVSPGASLSAARGAYSACGNSTRSILGGGLDSAGNTLNTTVKYTFSSDSFSSGTNLDVGSRSNAAASNSTIGLFMAGSGNANASTRYTFSTDTVAAAGGLGLGVTELAGAGNTSNQGVFSGGRFTFNFSVLAGVYRITLATGASATSSDLTVGVFNHAGACGANFVIFGGGLNSGFVVQNFTNLYSNSTNARTTGTNLGLARQALSASGNTTVAIFSGGSTTSGSGAAVNYTDVYTYSGNVVSQGTNLSVIRYQAGATTTVPGNQ